MSDFSVLKAFVDAKGNQNPDYMFYCPGCDCAHGVWTTNQKGGPTWVFDGNMDKPTFSPSLKVTYPTKDKVHICHSYVRNGLIKYLGDCTHKLAGKTVKLPEF